MNRAVFLCLILIFYTTSLFSQEKVDYRFDIEPGTEAIAITNRSFQLADDKYIFDNEIDKNGDLSYFHAKHIGDFDLHLTKLSYKDLSEHIFRKDGNWLLFVHGDFKTFELAVLRAMDIGETYDVNVIVFCWPSNDPNLNGTRNFKNSKANVFNSESDFMELLCLLGTFNEDGVLSNDSLSAFFHSLGNLYLKNYTEGPHPKQRIFTNLIMNSAAVGEKDHNHWVENLDLQKRVYILFNKRDFTLNGLRIFTPAGKQLGERISDTLASNAVYLDFSKTIGHEFPTWNSHSFYIGDMPIEYPNVGRIYLNLFHSEELNLNNFKVFEKTDFPNRYMIKD